MTMIVARRLTKVLRQRQSRAVLHQSRESNLSKKGKSKVLAVDGVDLDIPQGTIFGLIGPNGAGKTTLIKLLSTLIIPTSGLATVNGYDILSQGSKVRESIGLGVGGERSFYWRLTGRQNLEFFAALQGLCERELQRRVTALLELVDLTAPGDVPFRYYSTGMKRKLDLARALLADPPVLFLDEPTTALDPGAAIKIRQGIQQLKAERKTVLLVTHNLMEAEKLCDTIGVMNHGKLIASGSVASLKTISSRCKIRIRLKDGTGTKVLLSLFTRLPSVERLNAHDSEIVILLDHHERAINRIIEVLAGTNCSIRSFNVEQPSLEDVFFELTGR